MVDRDFLKDKKRIVIKVGSASLMHEKTGELNLIKIEKLARYICDLKNQGKEVVLVSSGAIAVGANKMKIDNNKKKKVSMKQALAAIGQAQLMMVYERIFSNYNKVISQVLITKDTILNNESRKHAENTFKELLNLGTIPIVNENDTVAVYEIKFGDNDTLSSIVSVLIDADLLIILSDIDGLYTDDPRKNPDAKLISVVDKIDNDIEVMAKGSTGTNLGSGGMNTKISAAKISTAYGVDTVIAGFSDADIISNILEGENVGTLFKSDKRDDFFLIDYIEKL